MTDQSSRFRKYGIYTMDIRRPMRGNGLGVVPSGFMPGGSGAGASFSPVVTAPAQTTAGSGLTTSGGSYAGGVPVPVVQAIIAAMMDAQNTLSTTSSPSSFSTWHGGAACPPGVSGCMPYISGVNGLDFLSQDDHATPANAFKIAIALLQSVGGRAVNGLVDSKSVRAVLVSPSFTLFMKTLVNQRMSATMTVDAIVARIDAPPSAPPSTSTIPQGAWRSSFNPGATGMGINTSPAPSPAPSSVTQAQDARSTQIDGGGTVPYFGPTVPTGSGTTVPITPPASSTPWSPPAWLVPVLAVMGGAALGAVTIRALVG